MNALLCQTCVTTDTELDICDVSGLQEDFATLSMQAIQPEKMTIDEEELHVLFEEAISDRIGALGMNRNQPASALVTTGPLQDTIVKHALSTVASLELEPYEDNWTTLLGKGWQRTITYVCIALMLMLIGFDLMGLLILHLH